MEKRDAYLEAFYRELAGKWQGSLVKPGFVSQRNAKEYLNKLAGTGRIERVSWGWYFVPARIGNVFDFLRLDKNFKVLVAQTAASFWNGDFIHRNIYSLAVKDNSYRKALEEFAKKRGWNLEIGVVENADKKIRYENVRGLNVEKPAESVADCIQRWAFTDAFAVIYSNRRILPYLKKFYWKRIAGTSTRMGQVISYGIYGDREVKMPGILKEEIGESIERVKELA